MFCLETRATLIVYAFLLHQFTAIVSELLSGRCDLSSPNPVLVWPWGGVGIVVCRLAEMNVRLVAACQSRDGTATNLHEISKSTSCDAETTQLQLSEDVSAGV